MPHEEGKELTLEEAVRVGIRLHQQKQYDRAKQVYAQVLSVWPECPAALHFSGLLAHHRDKDTDRAIELVARSVALAPEHPDFQNNLGNLLKSKGRLPEAAAAYQRAIELRTDFPDAYNNLGLILQDQKDYLGAVAAHQKAIEYKPNYVIAYLNLGNALGRQDRWAEAETAYKKVIELHPEDSEGYYRLGRLYWRQERLDEAAGVFRKSVENDANHSDSFLALGQLFERRGRTDEAVEAYRRAIEVDPRNWPVYRTLGTMLNMLGKVDEAVAVWKRWSEGEPGNPIPRHLLSAGLGADIPARAADDYVTKAFDLFSDSFDSQLERLEYRAPGLVADALCKERGEPGANLEVLDAGCGTGLCGPLLRASARWLIGVDLSPGMLDKARERGGYDELHAAELTAFISQAANRFDVIVSADTLCYFGDLEPVMRAASRALRRGGHLIFTVEEYAVQDAASGFHLELCGRYSHSKEYLLRVLADAAITTCSITPATLRMEYQKPVEGLVVVARKDAPPPK